MVALIVSGPAEDGSLKGRGIINQGQRAGRCAGETWPGKIKKQGQKALLCVPGVGGNLIFSFFSGGNLPVRRDWNQTEVWFLGSGRDYLLWFRGLQISDFRT